MKIVTLRTGVKVPEPVLLTTLVALHELSNDPISTYELVMLARNPNHQLWANASTVLARLGLLMDDGKMHRSIREVVLAAFDGEDVDIYRVYPLTGGQ